LVDVQRVVVLCTTATPTANEREGQHSENDTADGNANDKGSRKPRVSVERNTTARRGASELMNVTTFEAKETTHDAMTPALMPEHEQEKSPNW
jgi:hypothetical protein